MTKGSRKTILRDLLSTKKYYETIKGFDKTTFGYYLINLLHNEY